MTDSLAYKAEAVRPGGAAIAADLDDIVSELRRSREVTHNIREGGVARRLPSRAAIAEIVENLSAVLFPTHYGQPELSPGSIDGFVRDTLAHTLERLTEQVRRTHPPSPDETAASRASADRVARDIVAAFAARLPATRALLVSDLRAAFEGDPAATTLLEVLLSYPGMIAVISYRIARSLYLLGAPLIARLISNIAHSRTGIDIHPGAEIGGSFFIDHGTGVVIGETAVVGERVRLYQAVTLGAKRFPVGSDGILVKGIARHPIVEDDVVIYAGATVLGRVTIGRGSVIGGNVWLTHSVPPGSNVTQALAHDG
ncbi:MAG TPA: serine O-acetyltransferase EpsC [Rhizomicrobium sp.]